MTLPGGPADKLGNRYEKWWTLSEFVRMLRGDTDAIRIEDPGVEKAEFVVEVGSQRELHQAKRSNPNGKWSLAELQRDGLLEAIGEQLTDNHDRFVFASGSDAPELSELCDSARASASVDEFEQRFLEAKTRKRSFGVVCGAWACDVSTAVGRLRRIDVRTIGEHDLEEKVRWGVQALFLAHPTEVVEALRGIAEDSVHRTLRRQEFVDVLARRGYRRRRLTDPTVAGDAVRAATDRFLDPARRRLIHGRLLPRAAVKKLLSRLGESATDTVLTGGAGSGKTACVVGVVDALREGDVPALAFRLDRFVEASTTADLGRRLDLEESPTLVLVEAAKAAGKPGVLIIDQLDAVSAVSGRVSGAFELVEQLIIEARAARPRPIHVVVVCREFDWKNDSRLRRLLPDSAMQLDVTELAIADVKELLGDAGFRPQAFKGRQLEILALPQNLSLFLEANFDAAATPTFATATEIFARYWDAKREAVEQRFPDAGGHWMAVVTRLCQEMTDSQQLSVPKEHLDDYPARFVGLLASEGVISLDGRRCGFGHESFFDYVFARVFVTRREPITAFLKASEQHLFRRAQVRQVLAYLRDRDHAGYARELRDLLSDDAIRAHLKDLAFALLGEVGNATEEEWAIWETWIAPALDAIATGRANADELSTVAWRRFFGSRPWFAYIDRRGIIADWLASDSDAIADMAVNYLCVHQRHSPERVAELLEPYADQGGTWVPRLRSLMERAEHHTSRRFFDLFLRLLDHGTLDDARDRFVSNGTFWSMLYTLGEERPEWVSEVAAHRLRRSFARMRSAGDDTAWVRDEHDSFASDLIGMSAKKGPATFVGRVLPVVLEISDAEATGGAAPRRDDVWGVPFKSEPLGVTDACLSGLVESLATLGRESGSDLCHVIDELRQRDTYTANHLLLALYGGAAATLADEAVGTLCDEPWRFECGFADSSYWSAAELIQAVARQCTPGNRARLEEVILDYVDPFERSTAGYKENGHACFTLLSAISPELRSEKANARVRELARKFGEPEEAPRGIVFGAIESPIADGATKRMTDEQWLRAIGKYASGERSVSPEGIRGGARQLAERLEVRTREDPGRFARLALRLPRNANPVYLEAVLNGLRTTAVADELKLEVCRKAFGESNGPCGRSIVDVLRSMGGELPDETVQMLRELATEHEDPATEFWQEDAGGQPYYSGSPLEAGINSTRGRAAEAIADLIGGNDANVDRFAETVARMIVDSSASVRACTAGTVEAIACHRPAPGISLFLRMDLSEDRLLTTPHVYRLLNWSLRDRLAEVRPTVERMLQSSQPDVRQAGGRLAGLAGLLHDDAADLVSGALCGDARQRVGIAEIAAANIARVDTRDWCERRLAPLFDDADDGVRQAAADCFRELSDVPLENYDDLIAAFCVSRALSEAAFSLLVTLERSRRRLPGATCMVCGQLLRRAREEGADGMDLHIVVKLVFRMYRQHQDDEWTPRVLDMLDLLCLEEAIGVTEAFERFER